MSVLQKINDLSGGRVAVGQTLKIPEINGKLPDKVLSRRLPRRPPRDADHRRRPQSSARSSAVYAPARLSSSIARRNKMPVSTLARLNNMGSGDSLIKGQRLIIKVSARQFRGEGVSAGRRVLYTVRRGKSRLQHFPPVPSLRRAAEDLERHQPTASDQSRQAAGHVRRFQPAARLAGITLEGTFMGFLTGKRALIVGLATDRSIAWGIAQAMHREGATLAFSHIDRMADRVVPLARDLGSDLTFAMDVASDEDIARGFRPPRKPGGIISISWCMPWPSRRGKPSPAASSMPPPAMAFGWRTTFRVTA